MKKARLLALLIAFGLTITPAFAESSTDNLKPMNRIGINGSIEDEIQIISSLKKEPATKTKKETQPDVKKNLSYADLDIKKIADEITDELSAEQEDILADLRELWQAAVERSETIKFAIYKLSAPEGEKVDSNMMKKILSPIASIAPMVGVNSGNAIAGSSAILGGGMLGSLLADDSQLQKTLTRVTDADLIILAKEIDDLQQKLVQLYYNYITAIKVLQFTDEVVKNRSEHYQAAQNMPLEKLAIADAFYREALDMQFKARQDLLSARSALEQVVGNDALVEIEKNLKGKIIK